MPISVFIFSLLCGFSSHELVTRARFDYSFFDLFIHLSNLQLGLELVLYSQDLYELLLVLSAS